MLKYCEYYNEKISIHALREEGDASYSRRQTTSALISIHALREEGDMPASALPSGGG